MMIQERKHPKACRPSIKHISARVGMRHAARKTHIYKAYMGNAWAHDYNYMNNMADEPLVCNLVTQIHGKYERQQAQEYQYE